MSRPFLTARWSNLILANYATPRELLEPSLPGGLRLDERHGKTWCSIVAFDFLDTRVLGVPWPGFRNFPEMNLRFYVTDGKRRGVCFVREIVPQAFVCFVARLFYNEPYSPAAMRSRQSRTNGKITAKYDTWWKGNRQTVAAEAKNKSFRPDADTDAHFFKEHQWGFGTGPSGKTLLYEVRHPHWDVYPVTNTRIDIDWASLYGPHWSIMQDRKPDSVIWAAGSAVEVYPKGRL